MKLGRFIACVAGVAWLTSCAATSAPKVGGAPIAPTTAAPWPLGTGIAAVGFFVTAAFLPVVVTLSFLMGVAYPLRAAAIHRVAADDLRAQVASLASACDKVFVTAALLWPGVVAKANRAYIPFL